MPLDSDLWALQFADGVKRLTRAYNRFDRSRDLEDLDRTCALHEELNSTYALSLDLLEYVEIGRALLGE